MKKLIAAFSLLGLFASGTYLASAQTNPNCVNLTVDMGIGATDATTGGQVTMLQNLLIARGLLQVKSSASLGTFGPQTSRGVAQFQKGHGIIATGYVGPITRANIQTITCAIGAVDTSTLPTTTLATSSLSLLTFTSPVTGALIVKGEKDITPDWTLSSDVKTVFATALNITSVKLELIDSTGAVVGVLGNQVKLSARNTNKVENSFIRILKGKGGREDNSMDPGQYRLRATLVYGGADATLAAAAVRYSAESGWFSVVNPAPQPNIKFSVSPEFLTAAGTTTLTWSSAVGSVCNLFNGSATTSIAASGFQTVNVTQSTTYRIDCSLTSAWPFVGNSYTTTEKKDREVQIITGTVSATIATATVAGSPRVLTFTGSTNAPELGFRILNSADTVVYASDSVTIRNGQYSKSVAVSLFSGVEGQQYTIKLHGPTAITGSTVLASKAFTVSNAPTCSSGTWNGTGCVTTTTCNSAQTLINGVCVNNPSVVVATYRNFITGSQITCNSSIIATFGSQVASCTIGGGCTGTGVPPTTANPSANPTVWGACVNSTATGSDSVTPPTSTFRNFITGSQSTCNSSVLAAYGSQVASCTIGGGCTGTGVPPTSANPSANPTVWGACVSLSATSTTPPTSAPSVTLSPSVTTTYGGTTTITWSANPATGVTCVAAGGNLAAGTAIGTTGSWVTPVLYTTTQYGIKCTTNGTSLSTTKYMTVTVPKQTSDGGIRINLSANNGTIDAGKTTTIKWSVSPTDGVTCVAAGGNLSAGTAIGTTGSWVTPALYTTTQYGIKCTDASGNEAYKYVTVNVRGTRAAAPTDSVVLGASASNVCVNLPYNFHRGAESQSVTNLQNFLVANGYLDEVTGFYGDKTVAAVKAFQGSHNLPTTGMVYDFTRQAIVADSCQ